MAYVGQEKINHRNIGASTTFNSNIENNYKVIDFNKNLIS
jgi:hypothetical protein